jgi:hypothetical protein
MLGRTVSSTALTSNRTTAYSDSVDISDTNQEH